MIAKGNLHAHGAKLAAYLTAAKEDERAELVELRGFAADNIRDAFIDVEIQSKATRCGKPFFHAYVRLPADEQLTPGQWRAVADRIEARLGFAGQPRAVAFHAKADGEMHMHVAWSRIDLETMKAIDPGLYKNKLKELCRELEREFGLTKVRGERDPEQKTRAAERREFEQSRRLDTNLKAIRETIRACWDRSDGGRAFEAALRDKGLILARGDRRDFVVVDRAGGTHALGKRIVGVAAPQIRRRLADIDRSRLPTVREARGRQERVKDTAAERAPSAGARRHFVPAEKETTAAIGRGMTRAGGKILDGVAKGVGSLLEVIGNAFAPPADRGAKAQQQKEPPPMAPEQGSAPEAHQREEQARAERMQQLLQKYSHVITPENDRDGGLRPERETGRER